MNKADYHRFNLFCSEGKFELAYRMILELFDTGDIDAAYFMTTILPPEDSPLRPAKGSFEEAIVISDVARCAEIERLACLMQPDAMFELAMEFASDIANPLSEIEVVYLIAGSAVLGSEAARKKVDQEVAHILAASGKD